MGSYLKKDHHRVVSMIRWWEKMLNRPGKPKQVGQMHWEHSTEPPVRDIFNSHLGQSFSCCIPKEPE